MNRASAAIRNLIGLFWRHGAALAALTLLHIAVVERNLRGTNGIPVNAIPFDFQDSYSRFLIFISDALRAHSWPIWFPYGHAGSPFFVNPQSQLWNPLTWLFCLLSGYNLVVAQWHELLTVLLGSFGCYFLAHSLWQKRSAALVAAIAYNFTSARLCNAEHMDIVAAFSLFPWVFWSMRRLADGRAWAMPTFGIAVGVLVVSGYPGVVLLSPLWFGSWAVWLFATECTDRLSRKTFAFRLGLGLLLALGISSGYWLPIATNLAAFSRGAPLTADAALREGLSAADLWHLVYGTPVSFIPTGVTTDMSMRGLYFGIIALLLAVHAVLAYRHRNVTALGVVFVGALFMSMGGSFFLRVAMHDYLSPLNLSRFPAADSRPVASLAGCLLAAAGMASLLENTDRRTSLTRLAGMAVALLIIGLAWIGPAIFVGASPAVFQSNFTNTILIEVLLLALAAVALARFTKATPIALSLLLLIAVDSGVHASQQSALWSVPSAGRTLDFRAIRTRAFSPSAALVPRIDAKNTTDVRSGDAFLDKRFYLASYAPFILKSFESLLANGFRGFFVNGKRIVGFTGNVPTEGGAFQQQALPVAFEIKRYLPDRVDYDVDIPARTTLVFNEMYFKGWQARVDGGGAIAMHAVAGGLRALTVEAGRHHVETRFSPGVFWFGLTLSLLSWVLVAVCFARSWIHWASPQSTNGSS